ncbi:hypothetical protein [Hyalangium gracile]|uniref:hypothetical protein n=1 Tax=Hyalangium gracile TaxID=394092 RepID=UPI001CCA7C51|nr:hypothetical protein [Hyalangium gracile]
MKKLFHVLVVGGAVIGTGSGCAKQKTAADGTETPSAQTPPSNTATNEKPDTSPTGTPQGQPPPAPEKGGGAAGW